MSPRAATPASLSLRFKVLLLIAGPLLVALGVSLGLPGRALGAPEGVALADRARQLAQEFQELLVEARSVAQTALDAYPDPPSALPPARLAARLEGAGVLDSRLRFLEWQGAPAAPPSVFADPDGPDWWVAEDGVRTRLLARAGPEADGQLAVASFVIDSSLGDNDFGDLFARPLLDGLHLEVHFGEPFELARVSTALRPPTPDSESGAASLLYSPDGDALGSITLRAAPAERRHRIRRAAGQAWAVVLLVVLAGLLFDWPAIARRPRGLVVCAGLVVLARVALVLAEAPSRLLPRELGTASVYGSARPWNLLASPADLLLTAAAFYLLCRAVQRYWRTIVERHPLVGGLGVSVSAILATSAGLGVTVSLAFNSRGLSLDRPALWPPTARALLTLGLVLFLLGAAELWSSGGAASRWLPRGTRGRPRWLGVAVPLVVLVVACSLVLQHLEDRLRVDRLSSELAPQILEQSERRVLALRAALRGVQESFDRDPLDARSDLARPTFLAYRFWVGSELFHGGYKSSLDFYTPTGQRISHFGVDLPRLEEELAAPLDGTPELTVRRESFNPAAAVQQQLLHAELPITREGAVIGLVVGHVLDEPYNLSFLAWSAPFLTALGPGYSHVAGRSRAQGPHYVLFDATGAVLFSTLPQPPPFDTALAAEGREQPLRIRTGDELFNGLSLREGRRFHLLLVPRRTLLDRLSGVVRMSLLGLIVLGLLELTPRLVRRGGPRSLMRALRGSFRRKLLAAVLVASVLPLIGLALFLRGYIERRGDVALVTSAGQIVSTAQRVLEDYAASLDTSADDGKPFNDDILYWLRRVVGQEIHVYQDGLLVASSKRELFASGLLTPRLDGGIHRELGLGGSPYLVVPTMIGPNRIPVAYAPVRSGAIVDLVVAVPILSEHRQITRATDRVAEMILLATVLMLSLLAFAAAVLARTVARPVKELVGATARIANGDYATRLVERTEDEIAELVRGFNSMASSLARQRSDLERRRDYMEALLRHATTGVISTDAQGRVVTLNPAARALLSPKAQRLREGESLSQALSASTELVPLSDALEAAAACPGEPTEVDVELAGKPRRFRVVRVELPDPHGGSVGSLILLDDVTELMRSNQLAAWAEMARAIAHEIKNPLTPIQLSTEHLRRLLADRGVLPSAEIDACLDTVIKQVRTLYGIAGEFSTYARLPDLQPEPLDAVEFMRKTIDPYRASGLRRVELVEHYEPSGTVAIDSKVLGRAMVNLVENALEAMPDGGRLTIAVGPDEALGEVLFAVSDTGVGIDPEARRRLFEPYFSTKSSGTGLGLAIVRRAVEAHHGHIEIKTDDDGTTFEIRLPPASRILEP